jgi:dTDP-4-dehydrorhamnose reductase
MSGRSILLTGGRGLLGRELVRIAPDIIAPSHSELDVTNEVHVVAGLDRWQPDLVIHAAAVVGYAKMQADVPTTLRTNIIGTALVTLYCIKRDVRLVYISTDYVYPGTKGHYAEDDPVQPFGLAGLSKLGGECAVRMHSRSLVIRTSFCPKQFNFPFAFRDQYVSKDSVEKIAPLIYRLALSDEVGIINVGTERQSLAQLAVSLGASVPVYERRERSDIEVPYDTSFCLDKLESVLKRLATK